MREIKWRLVRGWCTIKKQLKYGDKSTDTQSSSGDQEITWTPRGRPPARKSEALTHHTQCRTSIGVYNISYGNSNTTKLLLMLLAVTYPRAVTACICCVTNLITVASTQSCSFKMVCIHKRHGATFNSNLSIVPTVTWTKERVWFFVTKSLRFDWYPIYLQKRLRKLPVPSASVSDVMLSLLIYWFINSGTLNFVRE